MTSNLPPDPATAGTDDSAAGLTEFGLIAKYLAPLAVHPGARGLVDDVAVLRGQDLAGDMVLNTDTVVAGVHFLRDDPADAVAERVLRVNLSDLAAKGARPLGYLLTLALSPAEDEAWIAGFTEGLRRNQAAFGWSLLGGDTVRTPGALTISVMAIGEAPPGKAPARAGAKPGDQVWVTGTIGDGVLGLAVAQGEGPAIAPDLAAAAAARFRLPQPRVSLGQALVATGTISASADISDGLVADLGHIADASGVQAIIEGLRVPLSAAGHAAIARDTGWFARLISGGDDYELLLTAPPAAAIRLETVARDCGVALTCIGHMEAGSGVRVLGGGGEPLSLGHTGYRHF